MKRLAAVTAVLVAGACGNQPADTIVEAGPAVAHEVPHDDHAHPSGGGCTLEVIRQRESGGNYNAVSPTGKYRGAYQFDAATWRSVGGTGDPAAASPDEQDARAAELMRRRGTQPWSVCR